MRKKYENTYPNILHKLEQVSGQGLGAEMGLNDQADTADCPATSYITYHDVTYVGNVGEQQ